MKGIVFTEGFEVAERAIGGNTVDDILDQLASGYEGHVELRKICSDAQLARIKTNRMNHRIQRMTLRSAYRLVGFCHGSIKDCFDPFGLSAPVAMDSLSIREGVFTGPLET